MKTKWLSVFVFLLVFSISSKTFSQNSAQVIDNVQYPFKDFGRSTLSGILFGSSPEGFEKSVRSNSNRQSIPTLEGKAKLTSLYKVGNPKKPLIILVPGIGGMSSSGPLVDLANTFSRFDFSVMTVNNPFSWQFALTLLPEGAPGYFPKDAKIFYKYLKSTLNSIKRNSGMKYSEIWLFSYSLGGQYSQELLKIDDQKKDFAFKKIIMMNPPLDISFTLPKYDKYNEIGMRPAGAGTYYESLRGQGLGVMAHLMELAPQRQLPYFMKYFPYDQTKSEILIGGSFKESLSEILYIAALVHPKRNSIFNSTLYRQVRASRYAEISKFSFNEYFEKFIWTEAPQAFAGKMPKDFIYSLSIKANINSLAADERVRFILTEDDPISRPEDIAFFGKTFGPRALVFKYGGHVGLTWFPGFAYYLKEFLEIK
jgi:hypothetical protein